MKTKEFNPIRRLAILAFVAMPSILLYRCVIDTFDMKLKIVNQTADTIFVGPSKSGKVFKSHPVQIDSIKGDTLWKYMEWVNPFDS